MVNNKFDDLIELTKQISGIIVPDTLDDIFEGYKTYDAQVNTIYNELILAIEKYLKNGKYQEEQIFTALEKEFQYQGFWNSVRTHICTKMEPYQDTIFVRNWGNEKRLKIFEELFTSGILVQETVTFLAEQISLSKEETNIVLRVLRTAQGMIIDKGVSKRLFLKELAGMFGLDEKSGLLIWDLMQEHKEELALRSIFQRLECLEEITYKLEEVQDILQNISDLDEEMSFGN